jgi:transcriptional regulator with XRE-family HTH domain
MREELGLSRAELARRALVDAGTVWRVETGRGGSDLTRRRIAAALEQLAESDGVAA